MPKKPFSGKAKKAQLAAKKVKQANRQLGTAGAIGKSNLRVLKKGNQDYSSQNAAFTTDIPVKKSRYELQFKRESAVEIQESKDKAMLPLVPAKDLAAYTEMYFEPYHDFPKRPAWSAGMSKEQLEMNEQKVFREYVTKMLKTEADIPIPKRRQKTDSDMDDDEEEMEDEDEDKDDEKKRKENVNKQEEMKLSYFELNLETWRQLWRVLEKSDVLLIILDVRYAAATFPPSLYNYIISKGKKLIIVLNKIDLIPSTLAAAWNNYFKSKYPGVHIVYFTSCPSYNMLGISENRQGMKIRRKKTVFSVVKEASQQIWDICNQLYGEKIDLSTWKSKIEGGQDSDTKVVHEPYDHTKGDNVQEGILTIGTLGHPNVGKSSLINSLCGKKLVSVSRTPGHTKHFQTIFLTKTVQLCDCPGLVFPSKVPKMLQVLMGSFPIAQLREPYSILQFLAERVDLETLLDLQLPEDEKFMSAFLLTELFAIKKGFTTARTARPDTYRAANMILRFALDGRICLTFEPPGYKESEWTDHPDTLLAEEVTAHKRDAVWVRPTVGEGTSDDGDVDTQDDEEEDFDDDEEEISGDGDKEDEISDGGDVSDEEESSGDDAPVSNNPFALLADD